MKAIVSSRKPDGSYPEVGMTDRAVIEARSVERLLAKARRWAPCRVEIFGTNFYAAPTRVVYLESERKTFPC